MDLRPTPRDSSEVVRDVDPPHRDYFHKIESDSFTANAWQSKMKATEAVTSPNFGFFAKRHPHPERSVNAASAISRMILSSLNDMSQMGH